MPPARSNGTSGAEVAGKTSVIQAQMLKETRVAADSNWP